MQHSHGMGVQPFRDLIKPKAKFYWDQQLEDLFNQSKDVIIAKVIEGIRTFDPKKRKEASKLEQRWNGIFTPTKAMPMISIIKSNLLLKRMALSFCRLKIHKRSRS